MDPPANTNHPRAISLQLASRKPFRLRAVESVEKCSWECFREGTKFRSVDVRLAVDMKNFLPQTVRDAVDFRSRCIRLGEGKDRARFQVGDDVCSEVL